MGMRLTKKPATAFTTAVGLIKSTPKDAMKLRMTGFECLFIFVIRRAS